MRVSVKKDKSSLQTVDFIHDTIKLKIKKWALIKLFDYQHQLKIFNFIPMLFIIIMKTIKYLNEMIFMNNDII